jgi:hypothetical protein
VLLVLVLAGTAAACGDGEERPSVPASRLPKLVLQVEDVPTLARFDVGHVTRFDIPTGERADPKRFGRVDGWKADYKRGGDATTPGPLLVRSQVDLFAGKVGARHDLDLYRREFEATKASFGRAVNTPEVRGLGDRSAALSQLQAGSPGVRFYTIAWTSGTLSASVVVSGFEGRVTLSDAMRLARTQQRRIAAASR